MKAPQISRNLIILLLASALVALFGASCSNTVHGVDRDVENTRHHIENAVR